MQHLVAKCEFVLVCIRGTYPLLQIRKAIYVICAFTDEHLYLKKETWEDDLD